MKFVYVLTIAAVLSSCTSNDKGSDTDVIVTDTIHDAPKEVVVGDSSAFIKNNPVLWHAEDSAGMKLYKPTALGIDSMSTTNVIRLINANNSPIQLEFVKTSHDTMYVHIPNSPALTEQIGSTGAEMYMASTTFSLTELKGIKHVHYNFEGGDHASPGVYDRSMFKKMQ